MINTATFKYRWLEVAILSLIILNLGTQAVIAQSSSDTPSTSGSTVVPIGPGDPLNITVIGESDLTTTYVVDSDGDIQMPYVGKVHVGGLSTDDAQTLVQQKLAQIYTSPEVTLTRTGLGGISVTVIGAVGHQGPTSLRRDADLNDAIQLAGPTTDADLKHINITHGLPGQRHTTDTVDLDSFLNSGAPDGNPALQDGDSIFVPKNTLTTHSVSVTGEVNKPGRYDVSEGATVFDLITLAGGLTPTADPTATYIQPEGSTTQLSFNYTTAAQNPANPGLNPVLSDGDQVVVPLVQSQPTYAILGGVLKPGEYPLKGQVSLLDAIALAGGAEDHAKTKSTKITRMAQTGPIVLIINASDTKVAATTYLQAGDTIQIDHGKAPQSFDPLGVLGSAIGIFSIFR